MDETKRDDGLWTDRKVHSTRDGIFVGVEWRVICMELLHDRLDRAAMEPCMRSSVSSVSDLDVLFVRADTDPKLSRA